MEKGNQTYIIVGTLVVVLAAGLFFAKESEAPSSVDTSVQATDTQSTTHMDTQTSGLKIETLRQGEGKEAVKGDRIAVDYTGMFTDGKVFDSSVPRGEPLTLTLGAGQVIPGWEMGILGMKVGEKRKLTIPPELAYGKDGFPGAIPPNSTLVFEVELKSIK
jgi:peptidylprolyl isomerase/FKBP-type peptidyl-prolyl cis-trans isomerase FkpA